MRWLLDEMLPPAVASGLASRGHDAQTAREAGLAGAPDDEVVEAALTSDRIVVTEIVGDFARIIAVRLTNGLPCRPVVFVRRTARRRPWASLARELDQWAQTNPDPYPGRTGSREGDACRLPSSGTTCQGKDDAGAGVMMDGILGESETVGDPSLGGPRSHVLSAHRLVRAARGPRRR